MAWLTVIPGFTPTCRAWGETCHSRRESSADNTAVGFPLSSGFRRSSARSANSGIHTQAA